MPGEEITPMTTYIAAVGIAALGFLFQAYPRLLSPYFGIDVWRYLMLADRIRQHRRLPRSIPDKYVLDGPSDYPPVLMILMALFPQKVLEKYQGLIAPFVDILNSLLLFAVTYTLTGNPTIGWVAQSVYAITPMIVIENSSLTPRGLGLLMFSVSFLSILFYTTTGWIAYLVGAVVFGGLLLLTHKLSTQAFALTLICFTLLEANPVYFVVLIGAFLCAMVVSRGFYLTVLQGHIAILKYWHANIEDRYSHQIRGRPTSYGENPDLVGRILYVISRYPILSFITGNPFYLFIALTWFLNNRGLAQISFLGGHSQIFSKLILWAVVCFGVGAAVAHIKPLRFIGEGVRYLEYGALPTSLVTAIVIHDLVFVRVRFWFLILLLLTVAACIGEILYLHRKIVTKDRNRTLTPELMRVINFLNAKPEVADVRIATIPLGLADPVMYFTPCKVFSTDSAVAHLEHYSYYFPVLRKPLAEVLDQHRLNHVLINEDYVTLPELGLREEQVIMRSGSFCLLRYDGR